MKTVAVFQSTMFDYRGPAPAGRDLADHLTRILCARGIQFRYGEPIEGETAWFLYPVLGGIKHELVISWAVPLDRDEDYWVIQVGSRASVFTSLFKRDRRDSQLQATCGLVAECLAAEEREGRIRNLHWLSNEEFYQSYAC